MISIFLYFYIKNLVFIKKLYYKLLNIKIYNNEYKQ
jgi:hypothetical protein